MASGSFASDLSHEDAGRAAVEVFGVHEHAGHVRELVLGLKYGADARLALPLAEMVAAGVRSEIVASTVDVVTWAPTTDARRTRRGFDHAEMIARHTAALCGLRVRRLLRRTNSGSQTHSSRVERLQRPEFVASPRARGHVLVVDDVVTTGATFIAASRALLISGANRVTCVAPSWTPAHDEVSARTPHR